MTWLPRLAREAARAAQVVDLPTPPLGDAKAMMVACAGVVEVLMPCSVSHARSLVNQIT
jgi:hypothetical protein